MNRLDGMIGSVTAVTGFEKGSGKTAFLCLALPRARAVGPVAVFTIGVDGRQTGRGGGRSPEILVESGDIVMTTETFARASGARFEVIDTVPGRTALGKLFVGRARRAGSVTLVGSEHFSALARIIAMVRREGWVRSVMIDGAVNRVTQVSALGDLRFVYTARVNPGNLARAAARVQALHALVSLPVVEKPEGGCGAVSKPEASASAVVRADQPGASTEVRMDEPCASTVVRVQGPLTPDRLEALPKETTGLVVEDFTKVFLEPAQVMRTLERYQVRVERAFELLCTAVTLQDVRREQFLDAVGSAAAPHVLFNPYEV